MLHKRCFTADAGVSAGFLDDRVLSYVDAEFFQAEDGIRDAQESRGLGDVYKRQAVACRKSALLTIRVYFIVLKQYLR